MSITMDYKLAMACGQDKDTRNMRKNGRKAWNEEDWNIAAATVEKFGYAINPDLLETIESIRKGRVEK